MIDLVNQTIKLNGHTSRILRYDCWWAVPGLGLFATIDEAMKHGNIILPAPVAIGEGGVYELLPPELNSGSPRQQEASA